MLSMSLPLPLFAYDFRIFAGVPVVYLLWLETGLSVSTQPNKTTKKSNQLYHIGPKRLIQNVISLSYYLILFAMLAFCSLHFAFWRVVLAQRGSCWCSICILTRHAMRMWNCECGRCMRASIAGLIKSKSCLLCLLTARAQSYMVYITRKCKLFPSSRLIAIRLVAHTSAVHTVLHLPFIAGVVLSLIYLLLGIICDLLLIFCVCDS